MTNNKAVANSGATTNGKPNGKEIVSNPNPELSKVTIPAPVPGVQVEAAKPKSIQERINRFYELEKLMERRDTLVEHLEKLGGFNVSPTGSAHLKITDDKGSSFGIAHPIVIGEMVHLAKLKLNAELETVEALIIL